MSNKNLTAKEQEGGSVATTEEVEAALENLSPLQRYQLQQYAQIKVTRMGTRAHARTWGELLGAAYLSGLDGTRKWDKSKVDFFGFLIGTMRSIAWTWKQKIVRAEKFHGLGEDGKIQEIPLYELDEDGNETILPLESAEQNPEQQLLDQDLIERVLRLTEQRNEYSPFILLELMEGKKGPEIQQSVGITKTQYETEMKWLRRNAPQIFLQ